MNNEERTTCETGICMQSSSQLAIVLEQQRQRARDKWFVVPCMAMLA